MPESVLVMWTPRRVAAAAPLLEMSRLRISQYCWSASCTTSVTCPAPTSAGLAPVPYASTTIGAPVAPEPLGESVWPVQVEPRLRRTESPGWNVWAFTGASAFHGVAWVPSPAAVAPQST